MSVGLASVISFVSEQADCEAPEGQAHHRATGEVGRKVRTHAKIMHWRRGPEGDCQRCTEVAETVPETGPPCESPGGRHVNDGARAELPREQQYGSLQKSAERRQTQNPPAHCRDTVQQPLTVSPGKGRKQSVKRC